MKYGIAVDVEWYPYIDLNQPDNPGLIVELLPLIIKRAQFQPVGVEITKARMDKYMNTGVFDIEIASLSWFDNHDYGEEFVSSLAILPITEHLITLPENASRYASLADINGGIVGTIRNYHYMERGQYMRFDFANEAALMKAIANNTVAVGIMSELSARYWSGHLAEKIAIGPVYSQGYLSLRLPKKHLALLPALNNAIQALHRDGTIEALKKKYHVDRLY